VTGMFYSDRGEGAPLLLIHGMWGDHLDWEPVLKPLSQHYRVIAVDLPGFGRSEVDHFEPSADYFTEHLKRLLDRLGIESASMMGNSFGGQMAMAMALRAPDRARKLVLVATGGLRKFSRMERGLVLFQRSEKMLASLTPELNGSMFSKLFFKQGSQPERNYIHKQNAKLARPEYPQYVKTMRKCMRLALELCYLDKLKDLKLPVLAIQGDHDPVVNLEWVQQAMPLFPSAKLVVFNECGHVPQLEQPERFVGEVVEFL
jgi:pimeloyl-ACP methyl ester carboxylesterase